jgi:chromosome segregation ATPase
MKDKAPIIVLIIVAAGLGLSLIVVNNKAHQEKQALYDALIDQSNTVTTIKSTLREQQAVNQVLETNIAATRVEFSNKLALTESNLRNTQENLDKLSAESKAQADAYAAEVSQRDKKITELESQNQELDKQGVDFRSHISGLESQIAVTKDKLARSEGDRDALLKDLKRLQTERSAWEERFDSVAFMKAQIRRLKSDLALERTRDLLGRSESAHERSQRLTHPFTNTLPDLNPTLNVELHRSSQTNAPSK